MSSLGAFLSSDNLKYNYQFLQQKVEQRTGINPKKYPDLEKQFNAMANVFANKMVTNGTPEYELNNLATMNNKLIEHAANFFCEKIQAKRSPSRQSMAQQQQQVQQNQGPVLMDNKPVGAYFNNEQGFTMLESNDDISGAYSQLVQHRNTELNKNARSTFDMPVSVSAREAAKSDNSSLAKQLKNMMLERAEVNQTPADTQSSATGINKVSQSGILAFNIDDDISNLLSINEPGADLPLYQNIMDLQSPLPINERMQALEQERSMIINPASYQNQSQNASSSNNFMNISNSINPFASSAKNSTSIAQITQKRGEMSPYDDSIIADSFTMPKNNTNAQTMNQKTEIYPGQTLDQISNQGQQQLLQNMERGTIGTNDMANIRPFSDNILIEKILAMQRDMQPKYAERTNYIIANSLDRDWFNTDETRYRFRVNFRPTDPEFKGAGIQDLYRNVTSIELVNALIPQDCVNIPFDTRIYIDILNFPYLLLQIQEFSDVFRGTNSHNDRAFSVLIFDKQHDSSVLSSDYISGSNTIVQTDPKTQFYREYRKTFYKYTPAYFEKKVFFNQPMASLPHMSINLTTPAGENLYTDSDVLSITSVSTIQLSAADLEYSDAVSYPNDNSGYASRSYIRIETTSSFSNKIFRLGDLIRIQGFTCAAAANSNRLIEFMNRESGHYILNTDKCLVGLQSATNLNQGYTSNIYIAPPGNLNSTNTGLDTGSYYISSGLPTTPWTQTKAKLININLQTHLLFKINTREGDVSPLSKPINV